MNGDLKIGIIQDLEGFRSILFSHFRLETCSCDSLIKEKKKKRSGKAQLLRLQLKLTADSFLLSKVRQKAVL